MDKAYEQPEVKDLGSLTELTLTTFKDLTGLDGVILQPGVPLGPVS